MDELNLQEIEKKLNTEFESGQRLVFWYDAEGSFSESVDQLKLKHAKILHLTETNAFRVKMLLEHGDTEGQYLIYAPFEKPPAAKNHLEDTLLYSRAFYADKLSLIGAEIGLPSRLRGALESLKEFFGTGKEKLKAAEKKSAIRRTNEFIDRAKELDLSLADAETIPVLAMCVIAGAHNTTVDDLMYAVLSFGDIRQQQIIQEFSLNGVEKAFWEICASRFGYDDPKPTLLKLVMSLFSVYTCKDDLALVPKEWELFVQEPIKRKVSNSSVLLENMMNHVLYQESFDTISSVAAEELQAGEVLAKRPLESLLHTASFSVVDDILIRWLIGRELSEDRNAALSQATIPEICQERLKLHFGRKYWAEYQALRAGYWLLGVVDFAPSETFYELIQSYCRKDYQIDQEYREFITALDSMEDTSAFDELSELIENIYTTEYLEKIVYQWNAAYQENGFHTTIAEQRNFYRDQVVPVKEKVAVIISDGFRYEAAKELEGRLQEDANMEASMSAMLSSLPAITMVGMAQLLPHEELIISNEKEPKVFLDGKTVATTAQREQMLKAANPKSAAIDYDSLRAMKSKVKNYTTGKEVIFIYHNRVDITGEMLKTEHSVLAATRKAVDEIFSLVKWLSKNGNVYRFLITADHGYIYTRRKPAESDKLEKLEEKGAFTDRRFVVANDKVITDGVYALPLGETLQNSDPRYLMLAKGMSVFKCGGGMHYVHGGASPQEMIIPLIYVKAQKGIVETEDAILSLLTDIRKITNLRIKLDFYQDRAVSDLVKAVTYRIRFEVDTGEIISNEVLFAADSKEEAVGKRIFSLNFDLKKKVYGSEHKYFLKIVKEQTNVEVMSRQVLMDLPFTDDFGFGV